MIGIWDRLYLLFEAGIKPEGGIPAFDGFGGLGVQSPTGFQDLIPRLRGWGLMVSQIIRVMNHRLQKRQRQRALEMKETPTPSNEVDFQVFRAQIEGVLRFIVAEEVILPPLREIDGLDPPATLLPMKVSHKIPMHIVQVSVFIFWRFVLYPSPGHLADRMQNGVNPRQRHGLVAGRKKGLVGLPDIAGGLEGGVPNLEKWEILPQQHPFDGKRATEAIRRGDEGERHRLGEIHEFLLIARPGQPVHQFVAVFDVGIDVLFEVTLRVEQISPSLKPLILGTHIPAKRPPLFCGGRMGDPLGAKPESPQGLACPVHFRRQASRFAQRLESGIKPEGGIPAFDGRGDHGV